MFEFKMLTNSRPTKDNGSKLVLSCQEGHFKLTSALAERLGIYPKTYVTIVKSGSDFYVAKGAEGFGAKAAATGQFLAFAAANAWQEMEGDTNFNKIYDVAEEGVTDEESGFTFFKLTFDESVERMARKKSVKNTEDTKNLADLAQTDTNSKPSSILVDEDENEDEFDDAFTLN